MTTNRYIVYIVQTYTVVGGEKKVLCLALKL